MPKGIINKYKRVQNNSHGFFLLFLGINKYINHKTRFGITILTQRLFIFFFLVQHLFEGVTYIINES